MRSSRSVRLTSLTDTRSPACCSTWLSRERLFVIEGTGVDTSINNLCDYLITKYSIEVPALDEAAIHIDRHDVQINRTDIFGDRFVASGTTIDVIVPFTGEKDAFGIRPTTASLNPPRAVVGDHQLLLKITGAELNPEQVRAQIQSTLDEITTHSIDSGTTLRGGS